jgi:hypothetical protein
MKNSRVNEEIFVIASKITDVKRRKKNSNRDNLIDCFLCLIYLFKPAQTMGNELTEEIAAEKEPVCIFVVASDFINVYFVK